MTAAIVGLPTSVQRVGPEDAVALAAVVGGELLGVASIGGSPAKDAFRSPPAQKARSPVPVRIPTSASSSSRKAPQAPTSSAAVSPSIAFIRSGRSIAITVTGPRRS